MIIAHINKLLVLLIAYFCLTAVPVQASSQEGYLYNGITYMAMQAENGDWMDTVWSLEVTEATSDNLFELVVSPAPKRLSVKALTDIRREDWVTSWNQKFQMQDRYLGLEVGDYRQYFDAVLQHLPETLATNDRFALETVAGKQVRLLLNDRELAVISPDEHKGVFGFWMSAWMSASHLGIYADGNMLANGDIEEYLYDLAVHESPTLDPGLVSANF